MLHGVVVQFGIGVELGVDVGVDALVMLIVVWMCMM